MTPTFGAFAAGIAYVDRTAAYAVIFSAAGPDRVVAVVQSERGGGFLPGGGSEAGETPEQTVQREVREEIGRTVRLIGKIGEATQYFFAVSDNCHYRMRATFFRAEFTDEAQDAAAGEESLNWLAVTDAPAFLFHACHIWAVEQAHVSGTA